MKAGDPNIVEVLENGDVIFDGRVVSSSEFIVYVESVFLHTLFMFLSLVARRCVG